MTTSLEEIMKNPAVPYGDKVHALVMATSSLPTVATDVFHTFAPNLYIREMHAPTGALVVGHTHKEAHTNVCLSGSCEVYNEEGGTTRIVAPQMFVAPAGRKMAIVTEDLVWLNVHPTQARDAATAEQEMFIVDPDEEGALQELEDCAIELDKEDYLLTIEMLGMTEEEVQQAMDAIAVAPFPYGTYRVEFAKSKRDGVGMFASARIVEGEHICLARKGEVKTPAGRYINHSAYPNAVIKFDKLAEEWNVFALRNIEGRHGGVRGEEITVDYFDSFYSTIIGEEK